MHNSDHLLKIRPSQVASPASYLTTATPRTASSATSHGLLSCKWTGPVDKTRLSLQFSGISKHSPLIVSRVTFSLLIVPAFIPIKKILAHAEWACNLGNFEWERKTNWKEVQLKIYWLHLVGYTYSMLNPYLARSWAPRYFTSRGGHWSLLETTKLLEKKSSKIANPPKKLIKTEYCIQNCQKQ